MNALDRQLLDAARTGDTDRVRTAIEGGARPDCRDEELRTPLLLAVHGDHVEAARLLVAAGADPDAQDRREESPWLATGVTGSVPMLHVLLPHGPLPHHPHPGGAERVVPLDGPHEDVAVSADGRTAYVTEGFTRDGYGNGITVVDLTGAKRPFEVVAGARPLGIAVL